MKKEIFYLYRFKHKCPYSNPLIRTMLLVLCACVCHCAVCQYWLYHSDLSFIFSVCLRLMGEEGTMRVSQKWLILLFFSIQQSQSADQKFDCLNSYFVIITRVIRWWWVKGILWSFWPLGALWSDGFMMGPPFSLESCTHPFFHMQRRVTTGPAWYLTDHPWHPPYKI